MLSIYRTPAGRAAVWHNHDLKSDQLISCIRVYMSVFLSFFFLPHLLRNSCGECNLGLYPGYIYVSRRPPLKSTVAESTIAGPRLCRG